MSSVNKRGKQAIGASRKYLLLPWEMINPTRKIIEGKRKTLIHFATWYGSEPVEPRSAKRMG